MHSHSLSITLTLSHTHTQLHFGHACARSQRSSIAPLPLLGLWPSRNIATQKTLERAAAAAGAGVRPRARAGAGAALFCLSYFTSFIGFYWQRDLNFSKRHLRCRGERLQLPRLLRLLLLLLLLLFLLRGRPNRFAVAALSCC